MLGAGDAADAIAAAVSERGADLVVGGRELGLVRRLLDHSVSGSVARAAHCDVLFAH